MTQLQAIPRLFDQTNPVEINRTLHIFLKAIVVGEKVELVFKECGEIRTEVERKRVLTY